jgi:hypothetical protein
MIWSLSGINYDDLNLANLQWAPQEMVDGGASALMEQNNSLPRVHKRDTGQLVKGHYAVEW